MISLNNGNRTWFHLLLICFTLSSCFKDLPKKEVFYENDFENGTKPNINIYGNVGLIDSLKITSFNNSKVLGRFNSNYVLLKKDILPEHNAIKIEFDLYIHDQWNGNFLPPGIIYPDIWQMAIDNNPVILTTFSNGPYDQSYPNQYQTVMINNKPFSDSWGVLPGVCSNAGKANGTSHYKIEYTTSHKGPLQLALNDVPNPINSLCLKSWSIDNLRLTAIMYK
jgi:hypothetical protein